MAAQERAKQAQMKAASSTTTSTTTSTMKQQSTTTILPAPTQIIVNAEQEKEKMMKALNGIVDDAIKKEVKVDDSDLKPPSLPPPAFTAPPAMMAPPPVFTAPPATMAPPPPAFAAPPATMAPPPPSFDIFEQQQRKEEEQASILPPPPVPPAFDMIENEMLGLSAPDFQAPSASAPPPEESLIDNFDGITPMAPPPMYPGEEQVQEDSEVFDFDVDGNALSAEEKRKMMEEQRAIMEQIKRQTNENKASEAAVRANAFETRMMGNHTASAPAPSTQMSGNTREVDFASMGMDPAEIEEQRKILEEIEKQVRKSRGGTTANYESPAVAPPSSQESANRIVNIGEGKKVALHGQGKTKDAIKNGTAILVQCMNCDNWMQITGVASLMFCPICNTVSPVVKPDTSQGNQKAKQMEEDRKLAERLQNEENATVSDYPGNRRQRTGASSRVAAAKTEESSWWDYIMGTNTATNDGEEKRSAEINMSRPPGQRALHGSSSNDDYESESLLNRSGRADPGEARVAESKSLFSCVVDSVSNAAAAAASGVNSMAYGEDEEVHGIDTTSFLAVPKLGDDRGSSGTYNAIPNDD